MVGKGENINLIAQRSIDQAFPFLDEIGLEPPARCSGCRNCQECSVRAQRFSAVEAAELAVIEDNVTIKDGHAVAGPVILLSETQQCFRIITSK